MVNKTNWVLGYFLSFLDFTNPILELGTEEKQRNGNRSDVRGMRREEKFPTPSREGKYIPILSHLCCT
jgi:hypothetical protein